MIVDHCLLSDLTLVSTYPFTLVLRLCVVCHSDIGTRTILVLPLLVHVQYWYVHYWYINVLVLFKIKLKCYVHVHTGIELCNNNSNNDSVDFIAP